VVILPQANDPGLYGNDPERYGYEQIWGSQQPMFSIKEFSKIDRGSGIIKSGERLELLKSSKSDVISMSPTHSFSFIRR
jgi:hypothetical protein